MLGIGLAIEPFRLNDIKGIILEYTWWRNEIEKKSKRKEEDSFDRKS